MKDAEKRVLSAPGRFFLVNDARDFSNGQPPAGGSGKIVLTYSSLSLS
jgi:hypothetical protein